MASSTAAPCSAPGTVRSRAKADRRHSIVHAAAALFAERGFAAVSLEEIGAAVGISGPGLYRHFPSKQALLAAVLTEASEGLLSGSRHVLADARSGHGSLEDGEALRALIRFHVNFALGNADVIVVQDRDIASLTEADRHTVRRLQREYVEGWVGVLAGLWPSRARSELRVRAHAAFGLLNSTPHSARIHGQPPADDVVRSVLEEMAWRSLTPVSL